MRWLSIFYRDWRILHQSFLCFWHQIKPFLMISYRFVLCFLKLNEFIYLKIIGEGNSFPINNPSQKNWKCVIPENNKENWSIMWVALSNFFIPSLGACLFFEPIWLSTIVRGPRTVDVSVAIATKRNPLESNWYLIWSLAEISYSQNPKN